MCGPACSQDPNKGHAHAGVKYTTSQGFPIHPTPDVTSGHPAASQARLAGVQLPRGWFVYEWAAEIQRQADQEAAERLATRQSYSASPTPPTSPAFSRSPPATTSARENIFYYRRPYRVWTAYQSKLTGRRKTRTVLVDIPEETDDNLRAEGDTTSELTDDDLSGYSDDELASMISPGSIAMESAIECEAYENGDGHASDLQNADKMNFRTSAYRVQLTKQAEQALALKRIGRVTIRLVEGEQEPNDMQEFEMCT